MFERLGPWLQQNFWVVWLGGLWVTAVVLLTGTLWRRSDGLPIRRPTFPIPFNVANPRRLLRWAGLDNDIQVADIVAVDNDSFLGRQRLRLTYRTPAGEASFWLELRQPDKLREAIAAARPRV